MIELALRLIDNLKKLAEIREERNLNYFDRYVKPAYQDAEAVFSDYLQLLRSIPAKESSRESRQK